MEKKSLVAEEILNFLEVFEIELRDWLKYMWFVNPKEHKAQELPLQDGVEYVNNNKNDLYNLRNYCKAFEKQKYTFNLAKNRAARLGDSGIKMRFEELHKVIVRFPIELDYYFNNKLQPCQTVPSYLFLTEEGPNKATELCKHIKTALDDYFYFFSRKTPI